MRPPYRRDPIGVSYFGLDASAIASAMMIQHGSATNRMPGITRRNQGTIAKAQPTQRRFRRPDYFESIVLFILKGSRVPVRYRMQT